MIRISNSNEVTTNDLYSNFFEVNNDCEDLTLTSGATRSIVIDVHQSPGAAWPTYDLTTLFREVSNAVVCPYGYEAINPDGSMLKAA